LIGHLLKKELTIPLVLVILPILWLASQMMEGIWKTQKFKAMGVFFSEHYAVIWFGTE